MQNPDIIDVLEQLFQLMDDLQYKPKHGKYRITKADLKSLIMKFEKSKKQEYKERNQKKSVRKLIENLQGFNEEHDSPIELMKDTFMYLLRK